MKIKRLPVLVAVGMLLVLCLLPKVQARFGISIGLFSPNLEEVNKDLEEVNKEFGTSLRFEGEGVIYSLLPSKTFLDGRTFLEGSRGISWHRRLDISFYQMKTTDSFDITAGESRVKGDVELGLIAVPIFLTRVYQPFSEGRLSPYYFGGGVGTVFTIARISRKDRITYPDGYMEETSWSTDLTSIPLAGQVLAGVEYRWSYRKSIFLEARYIASKKAKILDREGGIETGVDWSGASYRFGLMIGL